MYVAVGVPQTEHGIAVPVGMAGLLALHDRILSVYILQDSRVNHHVVETGVEHGSLCFSSTFHFYGLQGGVPSLSCLLAAGFKA